MLFPTTNTAFGATTTNDTGPKKVPYSADTVITKDNVNDILEYYGLDKNKIIKSDMTSIGVTTVGELENAINEAKKLPKNITIDGNIISENATPAALSTGTKTCVRSIAYTNDLTITYTASGTYYKSDTIKYWETASSSSFSASGSTLGTYYKIGTVRDNNNTVVNAYTSNSYLNFHYDYDVGVYLGIGGIGGIKINTITIHGTQYFYGSSCL